ncbi:hypothetical protein ACET3Z_015750 [Daucus carota]
MASPTEKPPATTVADVRKRKRMMNEQEDPGDHPGKKLAAELVPTSTNIVSSSSLSYPLPEAEYIHVLQNAHVFHEKLHSFHSAFGSKFKIPTIGGTALDLHRLFVEVTSRGGIEKVVKDRKWKEVTMVFKYPSTITSASFVLRKYYQSLLYHFEQVYYFRKKTPSVLATDSVSTIVNGSSAQKDSATVPHLSDGSNLGPGSSVIGTIDAKFDSGYIVTVNLGSEQLKGVIYHTPTELQMSQNSNNATPRRRSRNRFGDPSWFEESSSSGYSYFYAENYNRLQPMYDRQEKVMNKKIWLLWNKLTEAEKQVYHNKK